MIKKKLGFTLIELLVVISIIGVLAGLALVSFGGAQKQSRDTERKSDLSQYRNALENFASNHDGMYPSYLNAQKANETLCLEAGGGPLNPYLSACPADPRAGESVCVEGVCNYFYITSGGLGSGDPSAPSYVLYAPLETGGYWVFCSDGRSGLHTGPWVGFGNCPL